MNTYLKGFDIINPFGKEICLINGNKIEGFKTTDPTLQSNVYQLLLFKYI